MPIYKKYPAVDELNNFPPSIREAIVRSPEFAQAIGPLLDTIVVNSPGFKTVVQPIVDSILGTSSGLDAKVAPSVDRVLADNPDIVAAVSTAVNDVLTTNTELTTTMTNILSSGNVDPTVFQPPSAIEAKYGNQISAAQFGAVGDGVADDTAALNAFFDYITLNKRAGFMPGKNYRITGTLIIPSRPGWTLMGNGNRATLITQDTDNTPIIQLGNANSASLNHFRIQGLWFTYKNFQPSTNTNAICIQHYDMAWEAVFEDLGFKRGHFASVVRSGIGMPWGTSWDNIHFGDDLSGGAMNWGLGINAVPNNSFGRFFVELGPMVGPVFTLRGYNFTWDTVEFIQADTDTPKLFSFMSGTKCQFGTFKVENSPMTVGKQLIDVAGDSYIEFGHVSWNGGGLGTANLTSGTAYLFTLGAGSSPDANVRIGHANLYVAGTTTSPIYMYRAGNAEGSFIVDRLILGNGWQGTNLGSNSAAAATLTVRDWVNGKVASAGDVNKTMVVRDASVQRFTTAFTAPRTINLPVVSGSLHNGLYYDLVFDGSINGSNTAIIKAGTTTLKTVTSDKTALRFTWVGGNVAAAGWALTSQQSLS